MATFKIKLEDKAAFLNRMEKQGETISSEQIKNNKLESYFEVEINNPKQLETAKAILKQSPKINTLTEMEKKKLTKDELKEMVRQELQGVLAEKKKMKSDKDQLDENETLNESALQMAVDAIKDLDATTLGYLATVLGITGGGMAIAKKLNQIQSKTGKSATPSTDKTLGINR